MTEPITLEQLKNASLDAKTLEQVINGDDNTDVTSRLGATYPTLDKALKMMLENGLLGATPFATYQAMTASSLGNDSYAVVTNDNDPLKNGIYQKISGTWEYASINEKIRNSPYIDKAIAEQLLKNQYPSQMQTKTGRDVVFAFADELDSIGVTIDDMGNVNAHNLTSDVNSGLAFAVVDESDKLAFWVDRAGNARSANIDAMQQDIDAVANRVDALATKSKYKILANRQTDYMHIVSYGQSLSRGATSRPPVSTTQPYKNVTFVSGVLPRHTETHDYTSFKPLIEQEFTGEGESPTSAMLNNLVRYKVENGASADDWVFVGTAPGRGGQPIANLHKGTLLWDGMIEQFRSAAAIAAKQNKTYSVWAMAWTQGENDYGSNTTYSEYYQRLKQMHDDFADDVVAITKQSFKPPIVMYQVAAHRRYNRNHNQIALAQLQLANDSADIIMACPIYQLPHNTDNLHLTADSSYQLGRYYAKALNHTLSTGIKWQPLQPVDVLWQDKVIDIIFNKSNLVIDTTLVTQTYNHGFDIYGADGLLSDIITSVQVSDNRVRITLSQSPKSGDKLTYARGRDNDPATAGPTTGPRGNLRDNAGDDDNYQDSKGVTRYMHNWCVMFETYF